MQTVHASAILFSAADRGSITLGSVQASIPAVAEWPTLFSCGVTEADEVRLAKAAYDAGEPLKIESATYTAPP